MKKIALVISCEHAVNTVPAQFAALFAPFKDLLMTHRGIDLGALIIAKKMQELTHADFVQATATRLLIDCCRSLHHSCCFSEISKELSVAEKDAVIEHYYTPFRSQVIRHINEKIALGFQVCHVSVHSFTPVLHNIVRTTDIGLLYDPQRTSEKSFARRWRGELEKRAPELRVRMNYPYKGISDGFTTMLRKHYPAHDYIGIEIETNQKFAVADQSLNSLGVLFANSLLELIC